MALKKNQKIALQNLKKKNKNREQLSPGEIARLSRLTKLSKES